MTTRRSRPHLKTTVGAALRRSTKLGPIAASRLLASAVLAVLLRPAAAQLQFDELPRHTLPTVAGTLAIAVGDVDGDGDLDIVFGCAAQNRLYRNDGDGSFTDVTATQMPPEFEWTRAVALGDVDGDGDLDLVCGNDFFGYPTQNRLYLNNGAGVFSDVTTSHLPAGSSQAGAVAFGDVDGDGDLDLVLAGGNYMASQQPQLYLNNGSGVFTDVTAAQMPAATAWANAIALVDVNGDGRPDLIVGGAGSSLYLNNGMGTFVDVTATNLPQVPSGITSLALGDVDGDGDRDLVIGTTPFYGGGCSGGKTPTYLPPTPNYLLLNDGQGVFRDAGASHLPSVADYTYAVALGDVDGDGDLDLVFGNWGVRDRLHLNDGAGHFVDVTATHLLLNGDDTNALALGDLDGDGDLDIVRSGDHVLFNLQRQLHAPNPLQAGHTYTLSAYSRRGPAGTLDMALPYLSTSRASLLIPELGELGIVPMAPLPLIAIQQPAGVGSTTWSVPNQPALAGLQVYAQALLLNYPVQVRFTNVTMDVLVP